MRADALMFMLKKLRSQKTVLGSDLANALPRCIRQCRNNLSEVISYLQHPTAVELEDEDGSLFSVPKTGEIRKIAIDLVQRLDEQQQHSKDDNFTDSASVNNISADSPECDAEQPTMTTSSATSKTLSVEEEMALAIIRSFSCKTARSINNSQELIKVIRQEMTLFENGRNLQLM